MRVPKWALVIGMLLGGHAMLTGQVTNQESGAGSAAASSTGQTPSTPAVTVISGRVTAGHIIKKVPPVYPITARDQHIEGTVNLSITVDKQGNVKNVKYVAGPELLRQAAIDAVQQWKYIPWLLDGEPRELNAVIDVNFFLHH